MFHTRARKEHKKAPFLKAFARIGTISGAAKASRISRDAIHDWRRNDASFERMFQQARVRREEIDFTVLDNALSLLVQVIKPLIDMSEWPRITAELGLAMANMKQDLKEGGRPRAIAPSGNLADVSLSQQGSEDVAIPDRGSETSAADL